MSASLAWVGLLTTRMRQEGAQTGGLAADDIIEAVSAANGTTATHPVADKTAQDSYAVPQEVLARWEDSQYRVDLVRGP